MNNKISVTIVWYDNHFEIPVVQVPVLEGGPDKAPAAPAGVKLAGRPAARGGKFDPLTSGQTGPSYSRLAWT